MKSYIPFPSSTLAAGVFASIYFVAMSHDLRAVAGQFLWSFWFVGAMVT